mmetsp:Transcript_26886/g.23734  ORF Transcript_26886/g.23734 Transcript_26886/m.23734 type:complete len:106 (-) Transcript_26886:137-454(-)
MKKDHCMSYKKTSSRLINFDLKHLDTVTPLFSIKIAKDLESNHIIFNLDECSIGRTTKINYTWEPRGKDSECKNIIFQGSIKLILTISSSGDWYCLTSHSNINSK